MIHISVLLLVWSCIFAYQKVMLFGVSYFVSSQIPIFLRAHCYYNANEYKWDST